MQEKIPTLLVYALTGLMIGLWPLLLTEHVAGRINFLAEIQKFRNTFLSKAIGVVFGATIAIKLIIISGFSPLFIFLFLIISIGAVFRLGRQRKTGDSIANVLSVSGAFAGLCLAATLPWWLRQYGLLNLSLTDIVAFGLVTITIVRMLDNDEGFLNTESKTKFPLVWVFVYTLFATVLSFSTGIFGNGNERLWHHWGAYVGPAELLLSGAAIFSDFPAQYGLGPTTLLASVCGDDCWSAMYFIVSFTTLALSVVILSLALGLAQNRWKVRIVIAVISLFSCFIWTAFPASLTSPLQTPSVSGIRFLPAALLAAFLFFSINVERSKSRIWVAHSLWAFGALWSPESAFYVTFIWWPYYLFVNRGEAIRMTRLKNVTVAALRLISNAIGLVLAVCTGSQILYGRWPTLYGVFAYAINPPGPLPIDRSGAVWFFIGSVILGLCALWHSWQKHGDNQHFRKGFLVLLLAYSVFSYFLGRSHENNLLNIMPFMMLVLVFAISTTGPAILSNACKLMLASLLGWATLFGWNGWAKNISEAHVLAFGSKALRDAMIFPGDAGRAVTFLHLRYREPVTVIDEQMDLVRTVPPMPWSAIHGPANFGYIPSERRKEFLVKTAKSLKQTGWVVIDRELPEETWLADFDAAYSRTEHLVFGKYDAIQFKPKLAN